VKTSVTAHRVTCLEHTVGKCFKNAAAHFPSLQQYSEPGREGNLYCCLHVARVELAFFLHVQISCEKLQLN